MSIGRTRNGGFQQTVMLIDGHQRIYHESNKTQIVERCFSGSHEQYAGIGTKRPVIVFARPVHPLERLLMQQYTESVIPRQLPHQRHNQQIMIIGQVAFLENGSQFKLIGRDLVMSGFHRNPEFQRFNFELFHKGGNPAGYRTEIVVFELLVLRTFMPHKRAAGK